MAGWLDSVENRVEKMSPRRPKGTMQRTSKRDYSVVGSVRLAPVIGGTR